MSKGKNIVTTVSAILFIVTFIFVAIWNMAFASEMAKVNSSASQFAYVDENLNLVTYKEKSLVKIPYIEYLYVHGFSKRLADHYMTLDKNVSSGNAINGTTMAEYELYTKAMKKLIDTESDVKENILFQSPWNQLKKVMTDKKAYQVPIPAYILLLLNIMSFFVALGSSIWSYFGK